MNYDLIRPCPACPFRTDIDGYLHPERAVEIATALARGAEFACHKTTETDPDNESECVSVAGSQFCAGALIALERMDAPNQPMRIAERLGLYDPSKLDMAAPVGTVYDFQRNHGADSEDESTEPCGVADSGCMAPAGYLEGGVVIVATEREATTYCVLCDTPVCEACSVEYRDGRACGCCAECEDA